MQTRPGARAGLTLFCSPANFGSLWARIVLTEKDVDHARTEWVRPSSKPHPDLVVLNPTLSLPTLADRDAVIYPAGIICEYLDDRYPHPRLTPQDPAARALLRMMLARMEQELLPLAQSIIDEPRAPTAKAQRKRLTDSLVASSAYFPQRGWCMGLEFSLADCAWGALLSQLSALQIKVPDDPQLLRYIERVLARPSVLACLR
ncbi:MAG TPA: glutathione binding-like protein [Fontimonas sp.]